MAMDDDMPPDFITNHTTLCGISYPTTLNNLTHCCKGPVQVDNGCFQYCAAGDTDIFADCVWKRLNDTSFAIACNHDQDASSHISGAKAIRGGWRGLLLVVGLCFGYMF